MGHRSKKTWILISIIIVVVCILSILLPLLLRTFVIQAFKIPSGAMKPTLLVGDHILVDKLPNTRNKIKRGDIVVFVYPEDERKDFVKRR
jgi:signal peptidase I